MTWKYQSSNDFSHLNRSNEKNYRKYFNTVKYYDLLLQTQQIIWKYGVLSKIWFIISGKTKIQIYSAHYIESKKKDWLIFCCTEDWEISPTIFILPDVVMPFFWYKVFR